jgi:RNA polymerase sigma factor (sigma-70 family)
METESNPIPDPDREAQLAEDTELVQSILSGSLPAWHQFLSQYAGLIYTVVRRRLFSQDEDEVRSVYVDILELLFRGELAKYRGGGKLSTWLIIFARCRALDAYRRRYGRRHEPKGFTRLSPFDRKVHQLFHLDRIPLDVMMTALEWGGLDPSLTTIIESLERIEKTLGAHYLEKLDNEYQARRAGVDSARLLKNYLQMKLDYQQRASAMSADTSLLEAEAQGRFEQLRAAVATLSSEEKRLICLRFEQGLSARQIARELSIENPKNVYSIINKILIKLRQIIENGEK